MYEETITEKNKVITSEDLVEIISLMNDKLKYFREISENEEKENADKKYSEQEWSFKDSSSSLKMQVDFYDSTKIEFDKYDTFMEIYNNRIEEIKQIYLFFNVHYSVKRANDDSKFYNQRIDMFIYENKIDVNIALLDDQKLIHDVFELIKSKFENAEPKYDEIVKKKSLIKAVVALSTGFIPGIIIPTLGIFVPSIREIYINYFFLYPVICLLITVVLGNTISSFMLDRYYSKIITDKRYSHYDTNKKKSVYKDDIDSFVKTSEVLIGKNTHNNEYRAKIKEAYNKYKFFIPIEFIIMSLITIIIVVISE